MLTYKNLLLSTDGSDSSGSGEDILDFDTKTADRSMPLLPEGTYDMVIKEISRNLNDKTGKENLKITLNTTRESKDAKGETVLQAGFPVFHYIGLTPSEKYSQSKIRTNCALLLDAVFGKGTGESMKPIDRLVGKIVTVKTENQEGDASFGPSTRVKTFVPAKV